MSFSMAPDMTLPAPRRISNSLQRWRQRAVALVAAAIGVLGLSAPAQALVQIDITQGQVEPLPIACRPSARPAARRTLPGR